MADIRESTEILHRDEFAMLCNRLGLSRALEIGTDRGRFAVNFLRNWRGTQMTCVDAYLPYWEMNWPRDADFLMAVANLQPYFDRARIAKTSSKEYHAATEPLRDARVPYHFYDFIYIDGDHRYEAVREDLQLWWPRVAAGGILAGHDFDEPDHPGVIQAVAEFADQTGLTIFHTADQDGPPSWYTYRPRPAAEI